VIATLNSTDWAYTRTDKTGGLPFDSNRSTSLEHDTVVTVLGFPHRVGVAGANLLQDIQPVYGNGTVSIQGLNNGVITTTDTNYERGNSGGPVFYSDGGTLKVVGIVSCGIGRTIGRITPISALR
jgi:secreted trypsin-like serine protease